MNKILILVILFSFFIKCFSSEGFLETEDAASYRNSEIDYYNQSVSILILNSCWNLTNNNSAICTVGLLGLSSESYCFDKPPIPFNPQKKNRCLLK